MSATQVYIKNYWVLTGQNHHPWLTEQDGLTQERRGHLANGPQQAELRATHCHAMRLPAQTKRAPQGVAIPVVHVRGGAMHSGLLQDCPGCQPVGLHWPLQRHPGRPATRWRWHLLHPDSWAYLHTQGTVRTLHLSVLAVKWKWTVYCRGKSQVFRLKVEWQFFTEVTFWV